MVKPSSKQRKIEKVRNDIDELLSLAASKVKTHAVLSRNAVRDAVRLSQRFRARIPIETKRKLCKKCFSYLLPGVTSSTRVHKGRVIITCKHCGAVKRLQFRRGKK